MQNRSIKLANIFGIRVGVDVSFLLVLFFFIVVLSGNFKDLLDSSELVSYITAVSTVLMFFLSVILHEFGHALMARRFGIGIVGIDLWFFGGLAKMRRETVTPREEFLVSGAGPFATLLITVVTAGTAILIGGKQGYIDTATLNGDAHVTPVMLALTWISTANAVLLILNLIPAYPLDGGRMARAAAWKVTGNRLKATVFTSVLGRFIGYCMAGVGALLIAMGSIFDGLWLALIGMFLERSARSSVVQASFSQQLANVSVLQIMERDPIAIPSGESAYNANENYFLRYRVTWLPVVDPFHRLLGIVDEKQIDQALRSNRASQPVSELLTAVEPNWQVDSGTTLDRLLGSERLEKFGALFVVDTTGKLIGVVTDHQVRRAVANSFTAKNEL